MSESVDHIANVIDVIDNYLRDELTLLGMERLHKSFTGEDEEFTEWKQVRDTYRDISWDEDKVRQFAAKAKQIVEEGITSIPETYFDITSSTALSELEDELDRNRLDDDTGITFGNNPTELKDLDFSQLIDSKDQPGQRNINSAREGFEYKTEDGVITGRFVYTDVKRELSPQGDIERLVSEGSIRFRIHPDLDLLVAETTSVVDVQKTKSIFGTNTNVDLVVCGNLTAEPEKAPKKMDSFRNSFADPDDGAVDEPKLLGTDEVQLYNPEGNDEESVRKINLEGTNLAGHPYIIERQDEGYIVKGLTARVAYEEAIFEISISGSSTMGYVKIEGVGEYETGKDLLRKVRQRYLKYLRSR